MVFLSTDEAEEAVSALEMVGECLSGAQSDLYQWKWAIIALHNAAQGFMVLSLRGSNGVDVLTKKAAAAWAEAVAAGRPVPGDRLDTYLNLYSKTKGKRMLKFVGSKRFAPRAGQDDSVRTLNSLRNEFIHFLPKSWSIEVTGLPELFTDVLDYIEFLGWECGNVIWFESVLDTRAQVALAQARTELVGLGRLYAESL